MTPENTNGQSLKNKLLSTTWNNPRYYELSHQFDEEFIKGHWFSLLKRYARSAKTILDVGCGEGTILSNLVHPKAHGTGVDISPLAIKLAQNKYLNLHFAVADAGNLPFPKGSFDFCYNIGTLEHLTNPEKVIEEMIRVTKKEGLIAFWTLNFGSPFVKPDIATYSKVKKIIYSVPKSFYHLINPPKNLKWGKTTPKITSANNFTPDDDLVCEPYLQTLVSFLKARNLKIVQQSSGWETLAKKSGKIWVRLICQIANRLGLSKMRPFCYWGNNLFIIARKG